MLLWMYAALEVEKRGNPSPGQSPSSYILPWHIIKQGLFNNVPFKGQNLISLYNKYDYCISALGGLIDEWDGFELMHV